MTELSDEELSQLTSRAWTTGAELGAHAAVSCDVVGAPKYFRWIQTGDDNLLERAIYQTARREEMSRRKHQDRSRGLPDSELLEDTRDIVEDQFRAVCDEYTRGVCKGITEAIPDRIQTEHTRRNKFLRLTKVQVHRNADYAGQMTAGGLLLLDALPAGTIRQLWYAERDDAFTIEATDDEVVWVTVSEPWT